MRLIRAQKYFCSHQYFKGYSHIDTLNVSDLKLEITRLLHNQSGAMVYNIKSSDPQNTFSPVVRTLPENDTGCPHILQHLACCGSNKYPIRDPFFNMLRRSVSTYMNAWTGDDFTAYPFSSVNNKDFNNLYKVYLDMCLNPLLNQLDFRQEGWRYEINNETKEKQLKGIVFNQMKGAYQSPDRQLYIQIAKRLFNETPYGYDSGGKPDSIVKLSYKQVRDMHEYYYHPSNISFFYYGSQCIKDKLSYLESEYLKKYDTKVSIYEERAKKLLEKMPYKLSNKFATIHSSTVQDSNVGVSYNIGMLNQFNEIDLTCLHILSYILLQTNQAILYQQFIESRLADSFGASGFNIGSVLSFNLSLKNVSINQKEVLQRMEKCLQRLIETGVNESRLEQYLRQTELDILTPKNNQGIQYLGHCIPYMINRLPLNNLLNLKINLNSAVLKLKQKEGLREIIQKYFIMNEKKVSILQAPTQNRSESTYNNLFGLQMPQEMILHQQQLLKQRQQSNSANSVQCLPKLSLTDLDDKKVRKFQIVKCGINMNNCQVKQIHVPIDIKGIKFIKAVFTIQVSNEQQEKIIKFLDLWRYAIKEGIAVKGLSSKELSSKLNLCSNQFHVSFQRASALEQNKLHIVFSAACLDKYVDQYISLLRKIIWQPEFNENNLLNIFRSYKSQKMEELLDGKVMQYCLDYCGSFLTRGSQLFNSYYWVTEGIKIAESQSIPKEFYQIHEILQTKSDVIFIQHSSQKTISYLDKINISCQAKPRQQKNTDQKLFIQKQVKIAVTNAYDVNFCTQQYQGPERNTQQHAHISLFVELLEQDYLHPKIRQQGGAYGARAVFRDNGLIALYSYMDPKSTETFSAFEDSIKEILKSQISQQRLSQAKIKFIGNLNLPIVPQRQCVKEILKNYGQEKIKEVIQWTKKSTWEQIRKTSSKFLLSKPKSKVIFGKNIPQGFTEQKLKMPKALN